MAKKLTVVISQAQGKNPVKRQLEEDLAARLLMEPGIDVSVVPHLYDLPADHTGMLFLRSIPGDLVVLGWLYPRALRWVLDRQGVRGHEGVSLLIEDEDDDPEDAEVSEDPRQDAIGSVDIPDRRIYCIDLRVASQAEPYLDEIRRIVRENSRELVELGGWLNGSPNEEQLQRYLNPRPIVDNHADNHSGLPELPVLNGVSPGENSGSNGQLNDFTTEEAKRRWYPVIDYSRCTNCMECIDFCLFGVYGVDTLDRILVEAQDNCKKGCPACSRVCPENAIIFPQHKTPSIAGADGEVAGLKIDLSKLFGGDGRDPLELAVAERDAELIRDGRDAVGATVGLPKRQAHRESHPRDELDDLMDGLDELDV